MDFHSGFTGPECGRNLIIRHGRYGEFTSCSGYPDCKYIKQNFIGVKCPECKEGDIVEKKARRGNYFYGCGPNVLFEMIEAESPIACFSRWRWQTATESA